MAARSGATQEMHTSAKKPVEENVDLIEQIEQVLKGRAARFEKVPGHAGHPLNVKVRCSGEWSSPAGEGTPNEAGVAVVEVTCLPGISSRRQAGVERRDGRLSSSGATVPSRGLFGTSRRLPGPRPGAAPADVPADSSGAVALRQPRWPGLPGRGLSCHILVCP